ncbi:MAG: PDZ domain-containing protein [Oscillospiraceae bacterium]|nr:PDZ domain-containing protein [Oscillospiraceae bacterium]
MSKSLKFNSFKSNFNNNSRQEQIKKNYAKIGLAILFAAMLMFQLSNAVMHNNANPVVQYAVQDNFQPKDNYSSIDAKPANSNLAIDYSNIKVDVGGNPFGIKLFSKGCVIVEVSDVVLYESSAGGSTSKVKAKYTPGKDAGLKVGDIIKELNGAKITSNEQLSTEIAALGGAEVELTIERNEKAIKTKLQPILDDQGYWRAGIWVRDSAAGIGTLTFSYSSVNGKTYYAGLGHPICDPTTYQVLPLNSGQAVPAEIMSVQKSVSGTPGGLNGYFIDGSYGDIVKNNDCGIYIESNGEEQPIKKQDSYEMNIGTPIHGKCKILTTINKSGKQEYDAKIEFADATGTSGNRSLIIEITDKELLQKTGGIVQGMSGSPIVQNGKFVGAVTHVFVNEPNKGYGIYAQEMMNEILEIE